MAFGRNPSYLKRQKEQQRAARATQKREARLARKHSKTSTTPEEFELLDGSETPVVDDDTDGAGPAPGPASEDGTEQH